MKDTNKFRGCCVVFSVLLVVTGLSTGASGQTTCKVMSFNIWGGGGDSLTDTITAIQNSGADIIGIQEASGQIPAIGDALGFYYDTGTNTISRWPITAVQGYGYGQAVTITTPAGQTIYMFNCHLTAYPYPPYTLPDVSKALKEEARTQWKDLDPILENMVSYIATGKPVFLSGDFNVCSHLDYDGVAWKCSTECAAAGLTDSWRAVNGPPGGHLWPPDWAYDDSGISWTPKPEQEPEGKFDRIDFVYSSGTDVSVLSSEVTSSLVSPWPSDHRAVVSTFSIPEGNTPPPPPTLELNKSTYAVGEQIVATFGDGPGNGDDWIGIYAGGELPGEAYSECWLYTNGTQTSGPSGPTDGSVVFNAETGAPTWPLPEGDYDAYFLCCDGYSVLAGPVGLSVADISVDMYVNDITMSWYEPKTGYYAAKATVWIKDTNLDDVSGATVSGDWSGAASSSSSDTTEVDGKVTLESKSVKGGGTFTFTVTDVSATGFTYNPGLNVKTSDSITAP